MEIMRVLSIFFIHPDTPEFNVDTTLPPQCALDAEDGPPPIPPKQFSDDDILLLCKLPEGMGYHESERDAPPPCPPRSNQENSTVPPRPPKINQQITVSGQCHIAGRVKPVGLH